MTAGSSSSEYALGSTEFEHERLIRQATWRAPYTEKFFREAGIGPGQRVLDLGSGVGDVALLLARLVGASGEVVGPFAWSPLTRTPSISGGLQKRVR